MKLKNKLKNNELTIGSWITIGHSSIIEIMATAGFDWLVIDLEHSSISISKTQELIATIKANGMIALVRVYDNDKVIIKRVMDAGADGIVVPQINSYKDAKKVINSVHYPPTGSRGVGLSRAQNYGLGFDSYKDWLKNNSIIIAQIEHKEAVENIEEIISLDSIDGIIIGPYDLSASYGIPGNFDEEIFLKAIEKVESACAKARFPCGFHVINPEWKTLNEKIKAGYTFLGFSLDFFFLGSKARDEMRKLNEK